MACGQLLANTDRGLSLVRREAQELAGAASGPRGANKVSRRARKAIWERTLHTWLGPINHTLGDDPATRSGNAAAGEITSRWLNAATAETPSCMPRTLPDRARSRLATRRARRRVACETHLSSGLTGGRETQARALLYCRAGFPSRSGECARGVSKWVRKCPGKRSQSRFRG